MSENVRERRRDAQANIERIIATTIQLLGGGTQPSMGQVADAAGLSRQTLYAHFADRDALYAAVIGRLAEEAAVLNEVDDPDPRVALERWLSDAWALIERYPALLSPAIATTHVDIDAHEPMLEGLRGVLGRAHDAGLVRPGLTEAWQISAILALGHAAGQEVAAGRSNIDAAGKAFRDSVLALILS